MSKLTVEDLLEIEDIGAEEMKEIFGGADTEPYRPLRPGTVRQIRTFVMEPLVVFPTDEYD